MPGDIWSLFPYPTYASNAGFTGGALIDSHPDCLSCPTRACAESNRPPGEVAVCRYGISFARVDDSRFTLGIIADGASNLKRARRRSKAEPERRVKRRDVEAAVQHARNLGPGVVDDFEQTKRAALEHMHNDPALQKAVGDLLKRDYEDKLSESHDFLQLVKLIKGYAEVLLREKYPDLEPSTAADRLPTEGAIYYSTELMLVKMDSLIFLREANQAIGGEKRFRVHPLILKYVRIYSWRAAQKDLDIELIGSCYGHAYYNNAAMGALVQGLLDNMVKYSPAGSKADIRFTETDEDVLVEFVSLGPKILEDEKRAIFLPGVRGRAAGGVESDGLGIGLASAKEISDALGLDLRVEQADAPDLRFADRYLTTFSFRLTRVG